MILKAICQRVTKNKGLTLIEVLAVVVIVGIISAIAVPSVRGIIEKTKEDVCDVNMLLLERSYKRHLVLSGIAHSDIVFSQYLQEYGEKICDEECEIVYIEGKVKCSDVSDEGGGVPFF